MTLQTNAPTYHHQALGMLIGAGLLLCGYQLGKTETLAKPEPARALPYSAPPACPHASCIHTPEPQSTWATPVRRRALTESGPGVRHQATLRHRSAAPAPRTVQPSAPELPAPVYVTSPPSYASSLTQPAQPWNEEPYPKARKRERAVAPPGDALPGSEYAPGCPVPPPMAAQPQDAPPADGGWRSSGPRAGGPPGGGPNAGGAPGWQSGGPGRPPFGPPPDFSSGPGGGFPPRRPDFQGGGRPPGY